MSLPSLSIRRPVAVSMLFLSIVFLGLISFRRLPIDLLPDIAYPRLVIYTTYTNVAPTEVERFLTEPIEQAVSRVPGVERVESTSREGVSLVTLRFSWGTDMEFAALNVREQLDNLRDGLPDRADRPAVLRTDPTADPVMTVSVAGTGDLWAMRDLTETVFKRRLEQVDGVAQATVTGGLEREIQVDVDPERLDAQGLGIDDVADALAAANVSAPGGTIRRGRYRYSLRTLGEFTGVQQIGDVVVGTGAGASGSGGDGSGTLPGAIRVRDIATVKDGWKERDAIARYNGREAIGMLLYKESGANAVRVAEEVSGVLDQLRQEYPEVELEVATSQAGFIRDAISNVVQALVLGGALAFLVLFLFLRDPRYPVAVALAIPISVVATFALMDAFGVSLNIMSLGGLALGVGMLVDNSIVVLENVFRHREAGSAETPDASAAHGAEEVAGAITASTLTTVAVFGPIVYVEGVAGQLFGALSLAVAFSLLVSLLVALTLLPALAARWTSGELVDGVRVPPSRLRRAMGAPFRAAGRATGRAFRPLLDGFDRGFAAFAERYHSALEWSLANRGRVVLITLATLAGSLLLALTMDRSVLPDVDQGEFTARLELPLGTPLDRTAETAFALETLFRQDDAVDAVFSRVGRQETLGAVEEQRSGLNTAVVDVRLKEGESTEAALERLRPEIRRRFGPDAVALETGQATALGRLLGGTDADVVVRVKGEDLEKTLAYGSRLEQELAKQPTLANVRLGVELGQPELRVQVDREAVAARGLDVDAVANAVETSMHGRTATDYVDFDRRIPVVVQLPEAQRRSASTLDVLRVGDTPLRELVHTEATLGPTEVRRRDQARLVPILADVASGGLDAAVERVGDAVAAVPPPNGVKVEVGGANEELRRSFRDLLFAFGLALLLVYMILAAQFESFVDPLTILFSVPLALIGAVLALWFARAGLNTMSLIGVVILIGIVVNDAIVKVDFINQMRARGMSVRDAILEAGRSRLRPILMTTVTTVLGLLPMALGIGRGADLRAPLAIAVIGGLITATALTLIVVPVVYSLIAEPRQGGDRRMNTKTTSDHAATIAGLVALALLVPLASACGDAEADSGVTAEVRDSAGVTIVENGDPATQAGSLRLADAPTTTIGVLEGAPEYQLYQVAGARRLSDGRLVVFNAGSHELRYYGPDGTWQKTSGREGEGPGEFKQSGVMFRLDGDSVLVYDWGNRRFSLFGPSGDFVRSVSAPQSDKFFPFPVGLIDDDEFLLRAGRIFGAGQETPNGMMRDTSNTFAWPWRADSTGVPSDTLLVVDTGDRYVASGGSEGRNWIVVTSLLFGAQAGLAAGHGSVYYAPPDAREVRSYDADGALKRIVRAPWTPEPPTQEMRDKVVASRLEGIEDDNWRKRQQEMFADMPLPANLPPHGDLMVDRAGRVWLARFQPDPDAGSTWDVYDTEGRWVAAIALPASFSLMDVGEDWLIGVARDEMDVEQLQLWELVPNTLKG